MEKTYIVTARSVEDAIAKVKAIRTQDEPILSPTAENYNVFTEEAKKIIASVKLADLATKFNDVQEDVQYKIAQLLKDTTTTGNIWWDFKKLIEKDGANANIDMIKTKYTAYIKLFENFLKQYVAAGGKLTDSTNKQTVTVNWNNWFAKLIKKAKENLDACYKDATAAKAAKQEKAAKRPDFSKDE